MFEDFNLNIYIYTHTQLLQYCDYFSSLFAIFESYSNVVNKETY